MRERCAKIAAHGAAHYPRALCLSDQFGVNHTDFFGKRQTFGTRRLLLRTGILSRKHAVSGAR